MNNKKYNRTKPFLSALICIFLAALLLITVGCDFIEGNSSEVQSAVAENVSNTGSGEPNEPSRTEESSVSDPKIEAEDYSAVLYPTIDLNVRSGPGTEYAVIGTLKKNGRVTVTGKCKNGWHRVDYEGKEGYCYSGYLSAVQTPDKPDVQNKPYYIKVNLTQNIVTVYSKDEAGEYTVPVKAMVCSVGRDGKTPVGNYTTSDKYRWARLSGNVYGQYAVRISGPYLFHSVPYFTQNKADIEYEEYNKLGSAASLGCVRLCVRDVKWIYDNCPAGTAVTTYYGDEPEPLTPPEPVRIDVNDARRGWDPTDPDPNNPWQ